MNHKAFRRKQAEMDGNGLVTSIRHIRTAKVGRNVEGRTRFTYKYRYEVIVNSEIVKQTKSRKTAKKFLIDYHEAKLELNRIMNELKALTAKLKAKGLSHAINHTI